MKTYSFETLDTWQDSRILAKQIYQNTLLFPDVEKFGMVSQMRRAAISVCSNIAEGSARFSATDKARFYEIAYGSLMELLNQIILSTDLDNMTMTIQKESRQKIDGIAYKLTELRKEALNRNPRI